MTPEERIIGLEHIVADLSEMVASLCWGRHDHGRDYHHLSHEVFRRAMEQRDEVHTPKTNVETIATGRKFR